MILERCHRIHRLVLAIGIAASCSIGGSAAEETRAGVELQLDLSTAHVWRGITQNDRLVLQPCVTIGLPGGFAADAWGNWDLVEHGPELRSGDASELDLALWYELRALGADIDIGARAYTYHRRDHAIPDFAEGFATCTWDLEPLAVGLSIAYDFDEREGYYARSTLQYGHELCPDLDLSLLAAVGFADGDWSQGTRGGWHDYMLSLTAMFLGFDAYDLGASLSYADTLHRKVLPEQDTDWFGGVHVSRGF